MQPRSSVSKRIAAVARQLPGGCCVDERPPAAPPVCGCLLVCDRRGALGEVEKVAKPKRKLGDDCGCSPMCVCCGRGLPQLERLATEPALKRAIVRGKPGDVSG